MLRGLEITGWSLIATSNIGFVIIRDDWTVWLALVGFMFCVFRLYLLLFTPPTEEK